MLPIFTFIYINVVGSHTVLRVRPIVGDDSARDYHGTPPTSRSSVDAQTRHTAIALHSIDQAVATLGIQWSASVCIAVRLSTAGWREESMHVAVKTPSASFGK